MTTPIEDGVIRLDAYRIRERPRVDIGDVLIEGADGSRAGFPGIVMPSASNDTSNGPDLPDGLSFRLVIEIGADGAVTQDWAVRREDGPFSPRTLDAALAAVTKAQAQVGAAALADNLKSRIVAALAGVCERHGVTLAQLKGRQRLKPLVAARREAALALNAIPGPALTAGGEVRPALSLTQIGRILGGRDHATVVHYLKPKRDRQGGGA